MHLVMAMTEKVDAHVMDLVMDILHVLVIQFATDILALVIRHVIPTLVLVIQHVMDILHVLVILFVIMKVLADVI
jgi:hypothetical protein